MMATTGPRSHWQELPLGELAQLARGKFSARPRNDPKFYGGNVPFIQTGDVRNSSGRITTYSQTLNERGLRVSKIFPAGTLFMTIAANIGDLGITEFASACPDSLVAIRPRRGVNQGWLYYALSAKKSELESIATSNAQANLNLEKLDPFVLQIPSQPEQEAIAVMLDDANNLTGTLERLITKKQAIKQGMMQQLLTGRTRLPGFTDDWIETRLGNVLAFQVGFPFRSEHFSDTAPGVRLIRNRDLKSDDSAIFYRGQFAQTYVVQSDDILVGMDGDFTPCRWSSGRALLNQRVGRIRPLCCVPDFIYFALHRPLEDLEAGTGATTVKHLSHQDVESLVIPLPSVDEQQAIAEVLLDAECEIESLRVRLTKARAINTGMMQQLLTGRTRLPVEGTV